MSESAFLSIYTTYVSALLHSEGKRQSANQIYLSISLAIITAYSTIADFPQILAALMIVFVAIIWILTVFSYRNLAKAKFAVLLELERQLPFPAFTKEWERMPPAYRWLGLTRLETFAPLLLIAFAGYLLFQ